MLGAIEDANYAALDNVPFQLLGPLLELESKGGIGSGRLAIGMDGRHPEFPKNFAPALQQLRDLGIEPFVLYLECEDEILIRRYSETRRPHHSAAGGTVAAGIAREREALQPVKELASLILDTSHLNLYQLKQRVTEILPKCPNRGTRLNIVSFGFKRGLPYEADMVFDARFLPNPYYVPELRPLTGRDTAIVGYLERFSEFTEFLDRMEGWLTWSWPHILEETKAYHTVAIGCTGGHHRSVALAEKLAERMRERLNDVIVLHRELMR